MLKPFRETSQPEPSPTWNEPRPCSVCGREFVPPGGAADLTLCLDCAIAEDERQQREERQQQLQDASERQRALWREDCGVPPLFSLKTFSNFNRKLQPKAFDALTAYDYAYDGGNERAAPSLVLLSPGVYGVGKTHLVCALANHIIETEETAVSVRDGWISLNRCPVFFTTEARLVTRIRATFNNQDGEKDEDIYQQLSRVDLLILDDVGKVRPRDPAFLQGVYYRIIDDRYTGEVPVILTTNLDYAELEAHTGGASADRLREMCGKDGFLKLVGKSYRQRA